MPAMRRGRPRRHAEFDDFLASLPKGMTKRPKYLRGIGLFRGARDDTAWIKINLRHGGTHGGKAYQAGDTLEIKVGRLASWSWAQLEAKHDELQGKADRGEALEEREPTRFGDWAANWLERAKARLRSYPVVKVHLDQHILPRFADMAVESIRIADVNAWIADRLNAQKPATVKRELDTLKVIMNDAVRSGLIDKNPCALADPVRGIVGRQRFLDGEELINLLAKAQTVAEWLPDFILWCLHSGMRKGEVAALTWDDVRRLPDGRVIAMVRKGKTDQPRIVPCTRTMIEVLAHQERRRVKDDPRIFPIPPMTLRRKWEKARQQAGLEDVNLHDLRRTHSTHAAAGGVDLRTLADRIGHTDLSMLQKHYAAVVGSAGTEAADTFQRVYDHMISQANRAASA